MPAHGRSKWSTADETTRKRCPRCGLEKFAKTDFYWDKRAALPAPLGWCKACHKETARAWQLANPDRHKANSRASADRTRYGVEPDVRAALMVEQNEVCAICARPNHQRGTTDSHTRRLHLDHDAGTGKVRGLLCHGCNTGLGAFGHDPALLLAAVEYLRKHQA